jgi:hypothetical protein
LYNFYTSNKLLSRKEIFDRFISIGAPEWSLNRWLCNLTQNNKLATVKQSSVVINTTPQITASVIVPPTQPQPITQPVETLEPVVTSGGIGSGGARYMQNYMEGQAFDRLSQDVYK